jgi:hypothetical protein
LFERDAVLDKITCGFLPVPCEAHIETIAALSLFLPPLRGLLMSQFIGRSD